MATKRLSAKAKRVKAAMYRPEMDAQVDECAEILAELNGSQPSGVQALMAAAPDARLRSLVLDYEAEMNARVAEALRVGLCVAAYGRRDVAFLRFHPCACPGAVQSV